MTEPDLSGAMARIEHAIARIEAAALAPPAIALPAPARPDLTEAYAALDDRHGRLRQRVQETIGRLDALIAAAPAEARA